MKKEGTIHLIVVEGSPGSKLRGSHESGRCRGRHDLSEWQARFRTVGKARLTVANMEGAAQRQRKERLSKEEGAMVYVIRGRHDWGTR